MSEQFKCELCGEPMPEGEDMFKYHGYSGPCPKSINPVSPQEPAEQKAAPRAWKCDGCGTVYYEDMPLEDCRCGCTSYSFVAAAPKDGPRGENP